MAHRKKLDGEAPKPKRPGNNHMDRPLDCGDTDPYMNRLIPFHNIERYKYSDEDAAVLEFGKKIQRAYQKSVEAIIETGKLLIEAKAALGYGKGWIRLLRYLPFGERQVQMLMKIAEHPVLRDPQYVADLPASWATLYELSGLQPEDVKKLIDGDAINARLTRNEAKALFESLNVTAKQNASSLLTRLWLFTTYTKPEEFYDHQSSLTISEETPNGTEAWRRLASWIIEVADLIDKKREEYQAHEAEEDAKLARRRKRKTEEDGEWDASAPA